jgi:UDP-galactopyranose mutase
LLIKQNKGSLKSRTIHRRTLLHIAALLGREDMWTYSTSHHHMSPLDKDDHVLTRINYVQLNQNNHLFKFLKPQQKTLSELLSQSFNKDQSDFDIIIIGAGSAGIAAARNLQENLTKNYVVLEARSRVGGRIYSEKIGDVEEDFGASWIHNYSK